MTGNESRSSPTCGRSWCAASSRPQGRARRLPHAEGRRSAGTAACWAVAARQPEGTSRPAIYEVGKLFQLDRQHALLVASLREEGGHDFEVGNDAFIFKNLHDVAPEKAIPINRLNPHYHLKANGAPAVQGRFPVSGGFIPLGAKLPDGRPHPAAGTGVLVLRHVDVPARPDTRVIRRPAKTTATSRSFSFGGTARRLRVTGRDFVRQLAGVEVGRVGLSNGVAEGAAGLLCPVRGGRRIVRCCRPF